MTEIHLLLKDCTSITTKVILSECDGNILFSPLNLISLKKTHTHTLALQQIFNIGLHEEDRRTQRRNGELQTDRRNERNVRLIMKTTTESRKRLKHGWLGWGPSDSCLRLVWCNLTCNAQCLLCFLVLHDRNLSLSLSLIKHRVYFLE